MYCSSRCTEIYPLLIRMEYINHKLIFCFFSIKSIHLGLIICKNSQQSHTNCSFKHTVSYSRKIRYSKHLFPMNIECSPSRFSSRVLSANTVQANLMTYIAIDPMTSRMTRQWSYLIFIDPDKYVIKYRNITFLSVYHINLT